MAEASSYNEAPTLDVVTPAAGYSSGEVIQLADGRAGVVLGLSARVSGDPAELATSGRFTVAKTASVVILPGDEVFFDRSAGTATPLRAVTGADFSLGVAPYGAASAATTVVVDLNKKPVYTIDLLKGVSDTVLVGTTMTLVEIGGYLKLNITATSEAQKVDVMSIPSVPVGIPFIVEGRVAAYAIGSNNTVDFNIGIANETHATDADSIAESCFLHLDETLDIFAESDDGTTEVAATNTTVDCVDDTYFDFRIDARDLTDIQIYINGVNVLPNSVFKLDKATGPLKLLVHAEKTTGTATGEFRVAHLAIRCTDLAS